MVPYEWEVEVDIERSRRRRQTLERNGGGVFRRRLIAGGPLNPDDMSPEGHKQEGACADRGHGYGCGRDLGKLERREGSRIMSEWWIVVDGDHSGYDASLLTGHEGLSSDPIPSREDGTAMCCRERRPCIASSIRSASGQAAGSLAAIQAGGHASVGIQETRKRGSISRHICRSKSKNRSSTLHARAASPRPQA